MEWAMDFLIQMKNVFLTLGILFLIISYFKDNFNLLGPYYIAGVLILTFSIAIFIISFFKKL